MSSHLDLHYRTRDAGLCARRGIIRVAQRVGTPGRRLRDDDGRADRARPSDDPDDGAPGSRLAAAIPITGGAR